VSGGQRKERQGGRKTADKGDEIGRGKCHDLMGNFFTIGQTMRRSNGKNGAEKKSRGEGEDE